MAKETSKAAADPTKTYFGAIGKGRSSHGEKVDPFRIILLGIDEKATETFAAQGDEERGVAERGVMPGADEVSAWLKNPEWFLKEWPDEAERTHCFNLLNGALTIGHNIQPITAEKFGAFFVCGNGRHNTAAVRLAFLLMEGQIMVRQFNALVAQIRTSRGDDWRPSLIAQPPPKSAETGETLDISDIADFSQAQRALTEPEWYERAMRRVRAYRAAEEAVDYKRVAGATGNGCTEAKVRAWEILSGMHAKVREYVLKGIPGTQDAYGVLRRFPLTSAITFVALPKPEQLAKVQAMIDLGDTRVSTAKNTVRAAADDAAEKKDRAEAKAASGGGGGPSEKELVDAFSDALGGDAKKTEEPKPAKPVARGPWGVADLKKLNKKHPSAPLKAIIALLTRGPDRLDGADLKAIVGLEEYLDGK
mgnify:CR=1 FL=1